MKLKQLILTCLMLSLAATAANAEDLTGTLKRIKETGIITVGHRESSIPFSYYDENQNVIGYSQEYTNRIVEAVKKELNMPNLKVKYLPITSKTRIPLLQNGSYDIECGSTTNNESRQRQVAFSNTIYITGTRFLVNKNKNIQDI